MTGFVIWCPGRCGSFLAANVLAAAFYPDQPIYMGGTDYLKNPNNPITHTHNLQTFIDSPARRVMMVRDIFPAVMSKLIALQTDRYHINDDEAMQHYVSEYDSRPLTIDEDEFVGTCKHYDRLFQEAFEIDVVHNRIHYDQIQQDPFRLLRLLNIDKKSWNMKSLVTTNITRRIPIEKSKQVSNYQNLLDRYERLELRHKRITI